MIAAAVNNIDAHLEIEIAEGGLEARIAAYSPEEGGSPITLDRLRQLARFAGVAVPLDLDAVKIALERISQGQDPTGIVLARGIPPIPPADACVEWTGDIARPVFPGDPLGVLIPSAQATPGRSVTGLPLYPANTKAPQELEVVEGGYILLSAGNELVAKRYGLIQITGRQLRIRPLFSPSDDLMAVKGTVFPQDYFGEAVTLNRMKAALGAEGYRAEPSINTIQAALAETRTSLEPVEGVLVGFAPRPQNGEDGWFEPAFTNLAGASVADTGHIDYSERGAVKTVQPGTTLGVLHPATAGTPGMNIMGQTLPARDGRACMLKAGDNVTLNENSNSFEAHTEGVVVYTKDKLSVTDLFEVKQDVDYGLGNLRLKKGSVRISGNVLSGFTVTAPGNVWVGGEVQGAVINAGGDLVVGHGLVMGGRGSVTVQGCITARFAERATIMCGGDVLIANAITDSAITAEGKVTCVCDHGQIVGGEIRCVKGVEALNIGSPLGTTTRILMGLQVRKGEDLLAEMQLLKSQISKIQAVLGSGTPHEILSRTPPAKRASITQLCGALTSMLVRRESVRDELDLMHQETRQSLKATVKVQHIVYPGVEIIIGGAMHTVTEPLKGVKFYLDQDSMKIAWSSLR